MTEDFHRIRRLPPYVFEHINPIKAKARAAGVDIIDLGMGNPDLLTISSKSSKRPSRTRVRTVIRPRAAFPACARPRLPIMVAASA